MAKPPKALLKALEKVANDYGYTLNKATVVDQWPSKTIDMPSLYNRVCDLEVDRERMWSELAGLRSCIARMQKKD